IKKNCKEDIMLQAIVKKGKVIAENIPVPGVSEGFVLIKVVNSCISAGTEVSGLAESGKSIVQKALNQPDKAAKALNMIKSQGIGAVYDKIKGNSDSGVQTGYSISGIVTAIGKGVTKFKIGDPVAAAGAGFANHAEIVNVPENLVVKMPVGMDFKYASTVTVGAIAMHGVRRADLKFGEFCVVIGTGILGLLSVQMLKSSGVRIAALDLDNKRLAIAKELGVEIAVNPSDEDSLKIIEGWTEGLGADAVLFTAATSGSEPLSQAFKMCKRKGKVILVGVSGMEIKREDIYQKEIDFQISTSYGPGRYDKDYELKGIDYPYAYVRWTENRNMSEYLRMIDTGCINLDKLINAVYPAKEMTAAFESLRNSDNRPIIVLLDFGVPVLKEMWPGSSERTIQINQPVISRKGIINVALIGAGGFATGMHLPNLANMADKYKLVAVMDQNGHTAKSVATRFGAQYATTDFSEIINDNGINLLLIATRHNSHASLTLQGLNAGKHVFVEKPLAINRDELDAIEQFYKNKNSAYPVLMVGFNRRFSKYSQEIKRHIDKRINPLFIHYRMNAGYVPLNHWIHEDGGRIIGEGCHIIDLMGFFVGCSIKNLSFESLEPQTNKFSSSDNKSIILKYQDGSIATIEYFAVGNKNISKEYLEIHFDEKMIVMDDYKNLTGHGVKIKSIATKVSSKGHFEELVRLHETLCGENPAWPISLDSMVESTNITFEVTNR
ncbi:MAG: bi-domain-containing oxidoreductase, partial [Chitinivibrionales bacterium]